jgi:hypothetical protein
MGHKSEISWTRKTEDGQKVQVFAHHSGKEWHFQLRERRFDEWQAVESPLLVDWLELLDGIRRRIPRRLIKPEEEPRLIHHIKELFPDADCG